MSNVHNLRSGAAELNQDTAKMVARTLWSAEKAKDLALSHQSDLLQSVLLAGTDLNVATEATQPIVEAVLAAMSADVEARRHTVLAHRRMLALGRRLGIDVESIGGGGGKPPPPPGVMGSHDAGREQGIDPALVVLNAD